MVKRNFHRLRDEADLSRETLNSDLRIARRLMRFGELNDWCSAVLPNLPLRGREPQRVTPSAVVADQVYGHLLLLEHKVAFSILRITGCRGIALERLTWEEVDFNEGELRLTGKGGGKREVPIPIPLLTILKAWHDEQGNPTTGQVFAREVSNRLRLRIKRVCAAHGIMHFALHGLRRLRVREYRRGKVDVVVAAALLGHSPVVMMKLYDEASKEEKHEALQALWAQEHGNEVISTHSSNMGG